MTLYWTDKRTGEMVPVLEGLKRKPTGKVQRLPSPRYTYSPTYRRARRVYRQPRPLNDLLLALSGFLVAFGFFAATTVWPA